MGIFEEPYDCLDCNAPLRLEDGADEWGEEGPLCYTCLSNRLVEARHEARRWYLPDGTFETLGSPEEVVERRKAAAAELARLRAEMDALIARWPSSGAVGGTQTKVVYQGDDGRYYLETVRGGWFGDPAGPYPTREAAVRAAAGLPPAGDDAAKGGGPC